MIRALVTAGFLTFSAVIIWLAFWFGMDTPRGQLFVNLGTEMVGIVITVAVVELLFSLL
jgi:hypothetical protein